jgi:mRNA interferase MazF
MASQMRRGDVVLVDFEPSQGSETNKARPAVIVSNDAANRSAERSQQGVVTVIPVTSNVSRVFPFQTLIPTGESGLLRNSKAQAEQVRAVAVTRIGRQLGKLSIESMKALESALRMHLGL